MATRLLHFGCPDPMSREATSRTTRYRLMKKRKSEQEESVMSSSEWQKANDPPQSCIDMHIDFPTDKDDKDEDREFDHNETAAFGIHCSGDIDEENWNHDEPLIPPALQTDDPLSDEDDDLFSATEPLSPHHTKQISSCSLLVKQYSMRHRLTQDATTDLLQMLHLYLPDRDVLPRTFYLFEKQFQSYKYPVIFHYMCNGCSQSLPNNEVSCCPNELCGKPFKEIGDISSFMEMPIDAQLINLLQREQCRDAINKGYSSRISSIHGDRKDVYDGLVYQELVKNGFFDDKNNISLLLNTDGIPVFRSSSFSIWPILLLVNELPYQMRTTKQNRIMAGLWYGREKPDMSLFLKPLAQALLKMYHEGFETKYEQKCRVALLACTCDMPAKALVMNMIQFNGFYGCPCCLQKGKSVATGKHGRVQVFPFLIENPCGPQRTMQQHDEHVASAVDSASKCVFGVKGPSWLRMVPEFDVIRGMSSDYMHCVLLGVTRQLLRLWFTKAFHKELWYLGKNVHEIDKILCGIRPPDEIKRTPRSIDLTLRYWKAHELRTWLLHYSPVILRNFLHEDYYQHHLILVESIYLLLKDAVSQEDISLSRKLLFTYCLMYPELYEERYVTINVHSLLHLPDSVVNLGPLWAHSCFPFESANGDLLQFFHGSCGVEKQIVEHVNYSQVLPNLANSVPDGMEKELLYNMASYSSRGTVNRQCKLLTDKVCAHGKSCLFVPTQEDQKLFLDVMINLSPVDHEVGLVYFQIHLKETRRIIKSASTTKSRRRDNSGIIYMDSNGAVSFGRFQKLVLLRDSNEQSSAFVILVHLPHSGNKLSDNSITDLMKLDQHLVSLCNPKAENEVRHIVSVNNVIEKCILMDTRNGHVYASLFPNSAETE